MPRPKKSSAVKVSRRAVGLALTDEEYELLAQLAAEEDRSMGGQVRYLIRQYIKQKTETPQ